MYVGEGDAGIVPPVVNALIDFVHSASSVK